VEDHVMDKTIENIPIVVTKDIREDLEKMISREEIKKTIFNMNRDKALGLDGFLIGFFQCC